MNESTVTTEQIRQLILGTLVPEYSKAGDEAVFGPGGALDSLRLVSFLADLEYRLATELGRDVVLASDRAMSRNRSPFRDVAALTEYIEEELRR